MSEDNRARLLLTGSTGFLGTALVDCLVDDTRYQLVAAMRRERGNLASGLQSILVGDLEASTDWTLALSGVEVIIHTAACVHVMNDSDNDSFIEFRRVNVEGTLNLARQAAAAGVKRFIFISSIKVNGESTPLNQPYTSEDDPAPLDAYGISKREAEDGLYKLAEKTGMEVVIIRPPLVYGVGVKANFLTMMRWLNKGIPLPLGVIHNKRSLVALDNLVDLIVTCIDHFAAANQTFLVSDDEDLSTTELLQHMAIALGRPVRLLPVHAGLLKAGAMILGRREAAQRLLGSLQVDISKTKKILSWTPPLGVNEAFKKTAEDFLVRYKH
ncbi:MAG: SDR family oxidoreductase [Gammaproteobacteria bacterium]|nr:SDR family oxidoreductase [Gammaproteobacteria bacterium]